MLGSLAFKAIAATVILAVLGGGFLWVKNLKSERDLLLTANAIQSVEIETGNANLEMMGEAYADLQSDERQRQIQRKTERMVDAQELRKLRDKLRHINTDPDSVDYVNDELRTALEDIQGYKFTNSGEEAPTAGSPFNDDGGRWFAFNERSTEAIITNFKRIARYFKEVYNE